MQVKLGMPEILILFSLLMYSQSFTFSIIAFVLGLSGRIASYIMDWGIEQKKAEALSQNVDDLSSAFKDLFGGKKD